MGIYRLSHELGNMGFFSALGTSEHHGHTGVAPSEEESRVKRGEPNTFDLNNGVLVVYDEEGRPWIRQIDRSSSSSVGEGFVGSLRRAFLLKRGAYVPHSNDGGYFIREVLPKL